MRQGPPLATNLRRKLLGKPLLPFTPQDRFLGIIGTGDGGAVASKGPLCLEAPWLWGTWRGLELARDDQGCPRLGGVAVGPQGVDRPHVDGRVHER